MIIWLVMTDFELKVTKSNVAFSSAAHMRPEWEVEQNSWNMGAALSINMLYHDALARKQSMTIMGMGLPFGTTDQSANNVTP